MTNGDRIRKMDDNDLADFIVDRIGDCENCPAYHCTIEKGGCELTEDLKMYESCWSTLVGWLNEETEE